MHKFEFERLQTKKSFVLAEAGAYVLELKNVSVKTYSTVAPQIKKDKSEPRPGATKKRQIYPDKERQRGIKLSFI